MSAEAPTPETGVGGAAAETGNGLRGAQPSVSATDQWHRLHPATPLLRGGIIALAILGFLGVQLRDAIVDAVVGNVVGHQLPDDPTSRLISTHLLWAILGGIAIVVVIVGFSWLSWRLHEYRVTDELVEEREGVIRRVHRRGRLDRVQGVDIDRPIIARIFGVARLEIQMAGGDGNIRLVYLRSRVADELRRQILAAVARRRAATSRVEEAAAGGRLGTRGVAPGSETRSALLDQQLGDLVTQRVDEFLAPELDVPLSTPTSIVAMHPVRLIGSVLLELVWPIIVIAALLTMIGLGTRWWLAVIAVVPTLIGVVGYTSRRVLRSIRYSISATPDGIRVGFGLLSTSNDTVPADRIHAIQLEQSLLWRPFGWWSIRINRASRGRGRDASGRSEHSILPVGTLDEALWVVDLVLPGWTVPPFTSSPPRARWLRWFSRRWNAFGADDRTVVLRRGVLRRTITIVPFARVQSVGVEDGPLTRAMRLARLEVHTVEGVVRGHLGAVDAAGAVDAWRETERRTLGAMA